MLTALFLSAALAHTPPQNTFWVPTIVYRWEDAAAAFVQGDGGDTLIATGDAKTPFVVVRRVVTDLAYVPPLAGYQLEVFTSPSAAAARIAAEKWSRFSTTSDGTILLLTRR